MRYNPGLHRYAKLVAFATLLLIFAGGLVTSTGSGLSVPDWPLSFGKLFPKMEGAVFFEHGHRMVAGTVVFLTLILAAWIAKVETRRPVRILAFAAIGSILLQAVLGGMTVLMKLPPAVSVGHAGLAQAFFCMAVVIAVVTSPEWFETDAAIRDTGFPSVLALLAATTGLIYGQILLGAVMRHVGAGLAIPDFPLSFGQLIPPRVFFTFPVAIHFAHRVGALLVAIFVLWTAARLRSLPKEAGALRAGGFVIAGFLALQLALGALIIWTGKAVFPTTFHVALGALLLGAHVRLLLLASRQTFSEPSLQGASVLGAR